ncbi:Hypothetical predicted protein [Octopus vulgaris]|uniref:Uncharacterized protein n=1 Tax=Octopus vulgaris TaxID=6645 RepID=A0AA36B426_OCTVU|nr:Hypothetical predicted protein [Octopus vulgaris]
MFKQNISRINRRQNKPGYRDQVCFAFDPEEVHVMNIPSKSMTVSLVTRTSSVQAVRKTKFTSADFEL